MLEKNRFFAPKENWRNGLRVDEETWKTDATAREKAKQMGERAQQAQKLLERYTLQNPQTDAFPSLFLEGKAEISNHMTQEYRFLHDLTLAYASYGTGFYRDEKLRDEILYAIDWMYYHRYGVAELEDRGWRSTHIFNWHDWQIGSAMLLIDTLMLMEEFLPLEKLCAYLALFDHLVPKPRDYGANKLHYGYLIIGSGLLQQNEERVLCGRDGVADLYEYADGGKHDGQGFYSDGSYIFHTRHPMNGTYGIAHFRSLVDLYRILYGTEFVITDPNVKLVRWAVDTFYPFYAHGNCMRSVLGRHPTGERGTGRGFLLAFCELLPLTTGEEKKTVENVVLRMLADAPEYTPEDMAALLTHPAAVELLRLAAENKNTVPAPRNEVKVFGNEDRVVVHRPEYAYGLAISSSRVYNYECINHENMDGWYGGDGMLCYYGDDHTQYDAEYWENANPYRRPGTTVDTQQRELATIAQANEYLSSQDFVGGITAGQTGAAAMRLESYHSDGKLISARFYQPDGSYGSAPPAHDCSLLAKKAWFFLPDAMVALGAEISAHDDKEVLTVIENRKNAGVPVVMPAEKGGVSGFYVNGAGAYCFAQPTNITTVVTTGKPSFTEVTISHGVNPQNGTYAYAHLPHAGAEELSFPAKILRNDGGVQAIADEQNGIKYFVFWQADECDGVKTDGALLVTVQGEKVLVADPTQKRTKVQIWLNGKCYAADVTDRYGATVEATAL